ncbi:UPF0481 protein At3g47200-like [Quercus lobata]|uniref:Uncharacterized protein n=1 Tax=Quercus lobata TaxID=97700 RepID=A0A7N2MHN7_QUELO|nr:UPF0481 protein At3g47200-like [Quercus lobata]
MENSASGQIQQEAEQLVIDFATMLKTSEILASDECRIYKVPHHLRKWNEESYKPRSISIGPYHHDKEKFQTMEKHKVRYFRSFMQRAEINLENLVTTIRKMEDIIRPCYVDTVQLERDDFVKMIMLDATFILELFLKAESEEWTRDDPMVVEAWLYDMVTRELLLLENQLPFFFIKKLYHLALPSRSNSLSLIQLTFDFFKHWNIHNKAPEGEIKHFTDLLRFFALPPHDKLPQRNRKTVFPKYSATQLRAAGVKFEVVPNKCLLDLSFKEGVLKIPLLEFDDSTEADVRNIMALEQCYHINDRYITDFYIILDYLINTTKDVDLLVEKGIIINSLEDSNAVAFMINNLNKGIFLKNMNSDLCYLCEKLNAFYEEPWHRWNAFLRHEYFSTPLKVASSIPGLVLLVLTLLQTVFAILQVVFKR